MPNEHTIGRIFNNEYDARTHGIGVNLVDSNTLVGFELELENVDAVVGFPILQDSPLWKADMDHSLRGPSIEWKFSMPLRGADVEAALKELENNITLHCNPIKSDRTSTHVHINVNDLSKYELYRFILLAITLERLLYRYAGTNRESSIFCVPFYKSDINIEDLKYLLDNTLTMTTNTARIMSEGLRYSGINFATIKTYGTLEFRMLGAEWRYEKVIEWINILLSIKQYAINMEKSMVDLHKELSVWGMDKLVTDVFGQYADRFNYETMQLDVLRGIRLAQQIEYSNTNLNLVWKLEPLAKESKVKVKPTLVKSFLRQKRKKKETPTTSQAHEDFFQFVQANVNAEQIFVDEVLNEDEGV